jgi:hypothetical protein
VKDILLVSLPPSVEFKGLLKCPNSTVMTRSCKPYREFVVLTAGKIEIAVFFVKTPSSFLDGYQCGGGTFVSLTYR